MGFSPEFLCYSLWRRFAWIGCQFRPLEAVLNVIYTVAFDGLKHGVLGSLSDLFSALRTFLPRARFAECEVVLMRRRCWLAG